MFVEDGGIFREPLPPLLLDQPVLSAEEYLASPSASCSLSTTLYDPMEIVFPLQRPSPWRLPVKDVVKDHIVQAKVVAFATMDEDQFPEFWRDLLHRRYDGTFLDVAGQWRVSGHPCVSGRIRIRLENDHVSSSGPEMQTLLLTTLEGCDGDSLYQWICRHLDWRQVYAFALIHTLQTPWSKMCCHDDNPHPPETTVPAPFRFGASQCTTKLVLFTSPNFPTEALHPRIVTQWMRSRVADYLLNFSQDILTIPFDDLFDKLL